MNRRCAPWLNNRIDGLPRSDTQSIKYVATHAPQFLPIVQSCMTTARVHGMLRARSCKLVGYELLPSRCGYCYKCCREWLVLKELGVCKPSNAYEEYARERLVQCAPFCFGPVAHGWDREEVMTRFSCRPCDINQESTTSVLA